MGKIFEQQTVDLTTGEVTSITSVSVRKNEETFGMHRSTEGVDWILQFKGIELHMIVFLLELENIKTGIITVGKLQRDDILRKFGITLNYYNKVLGRLIEHKALVKLSPNDYLLNPCYFYKGGTKDWKIKYEFFKSKLIS